MKTPTLFKEYIWLVNTIRRARRITLAEINERWTATEMSGGLPMSRSTFNRHKDAIEEMFGLYIECDRRGGNKYYIGNEHVLREDSVQNWLLSTLAVGNLITESMALQDRIVLENTPSEHGFLEVVIEAMKESRVLEVKYQKYLSDEVTTRRLAPYCIKLLSRRWYMLGRNAEGTLRIFSLDRMMDVRLTDERFKMDEAFDAADYFSEFFGVYTSRDVPVERIRLRAFGREQQAMEDLPLHHSQRTLDRGDDYTDFEVRLRPTSDFKARLLSRGRWLKVLAPEWLAEDIRQLHLEAAE